MKFFDARCEACGQYHDNPDDLVAFTVRDHALKRVELGGEQPWSGVRVICPRCVAFLRDDAVDGLLAACRFAIEALGRQSGYYPKDPVIARVILDLEAAVAKAEGRDK